jgi:hypothetical protein
MDGSEWANNLGSFLVEISILPSSPGEIGSSAYAKAISADDPIAYYRFNDIPPVARNSSRLGAALNGTYFGEAVPGDRAPRPPEFPGFEVENTALQCIGDSWVIAPGFGISTDTATFSAWVNPRSHVPLAGIVFNRSADGLATGLNLENDGQLGYHWNDASSTWSWSSGISVPLNQWSLVALVVEPTQATVHLFNGSGMQTAVNTTTHGPATRNSLIGRPMTETIRRGERGAGCLRGQKTSACEGGGRCSRGPKAGQASSGGASQSRTGGFVLVWPGRSQVRGKNDGRLPEGSSRCFSGCRTV